MLLPHITLSRWLLKSSHSRSTLQWTFLPFTQSLCDCDTSFLRIFSSMPLCFFLGITLFFFLFSSFFCFFFSWRLLCPKKGEWKNLFPQKNTTKEKKVRKFTNLNDEVDESEIAQAKREWIHQPEISEIFSNRQKKQKLDQFHSWNKFWSSTKDYVEKITEWKGESKRVSNPPKLLVFNWWSSTYFQKAWGNRSLLLPLLPLFLLNPSIPCIWLGVSFLCFHEMNFFNHLSLSLFFVFVFVFVVSCFYFFICKKQLWEQGVTVHLCHNTHSKNDASGFFSSSSCSLSSAPLSSAHSHLPALICLLSSAPGMIDFLQNCCNIQFYFLFFFCDSICEVLHSFFSLVFLFLFLFCSSLTTKKTQRGEQQKKCFFLFFWIDLREQNNDRLETRKNWETGGRFLFVTPLQLIFVFAHWLCLSLFFCHTLSSYFDPIHQFCCPASSSFQTSASDEKEHVSWLVLISGGCGEGFARPVVSESSSPRQLSLFFHQRPPSPRNWIRCPTRWQHSTKWTKPRKKCDQESKEEGENLSVMKKKTKTVTGGCSCCITNQRHLTKNKRRGKKITKNRQGRNSCEKHFCVLQNKRTAKHKHEIVGREKKKKKRKLTKHRRMVTISEAHSKWTLDCKPSIAWKNQKMVFWNTQKKTRKCQPLIEWSQINQKKSQTKQNKKQKMKKSISVLRSD